MAAVFVLGPLFLVGYLALRWRSLWPVAIILLNPICLFFGSGIREWFSDTPKFLHVGIPGNVEACNLDPGMRCYFRGTGYCKKYGDEWCTLDSRNAGLQLMVTILGQPRGTYHGPYPSKEEAATNTKTNYSVTPIELFLQGKVVVGEREMDLGTNTVQELLRESNLYEFAFDSSALRQVKASIFQEQCLVVRVSLEERLENGDILDSSDGIVLFDAKNLHPFARYYLSGREMRSDSRLLAE